MTQEAKPKIILLLRYEVLTGPRFEAVRFSRGLDLFVKRILGSGLGGSHNEAAGSFGASGETALDVLEYRCSPWPGPAPSIGHQSVTNTARVAR